MYENTSAVDPNQELSSTEKANILQSSITAKKAPPMPQQQPIAQGLGAEQQLQQPQPMQQIAQQPIAQPEALAAPSGAKAVPPSILEKYHSGQLPEELAVKLENAFQQGKIAGLDVPETMQVAGESLVDANMVDRERGAGFLTRSLASIKASEAGKINYLKKKFGENNVAKDTKGNVVFREAEGLGWRAFDEKGFDIGDLADFSGDAVEGVAGVGGALGGTVATGGLGALAGGAIGAATGNAARQGLSILIPGDDELSAEDRVKQAGVSAVVGAAAGGAGVAGKKAFDSAKKLKDKVQHGKAVVAGADMLKKELSDSLENRAKDAAVGLPGLTGETKESIIKEGIELEKSVGPLSAGQLSKSQPGLRKEALARNTESTSQRVRDFDRMQLKVAEKKLKVVMQSLGPDESMGSAGTKLKAAYDGAVKKAVSVRRKQADIDFAAIDTVAGRQRIFSRDALPKFDEAIREVMETSLPPTSRIQQDKSFKAAQSLLDSVGNGWSASDMQSTLSFFSNSSVGAGGLFTDHGSALNRMVAGKLQRALIDDIDSLAETGKGLSDRAPREALGLLKVARDNYRVNSRKISELRDTALGGIMGRHNLTSEMLDEAGNGLIESGDRIAKALDNMTSSELRMTRNILEDHDPAALQSLQRLKIESLLNKSLASATSGDAAVSDISAAAFNRNFRKNAEALKAILPAKQYLQTKQVSQYLSRVADRGATGESATGNYLFQAIKTFATQGAGAIGLDALKAMTVGQAHKTTVEMMLDAKAREAMVTLARAKEAPTRKATEAASYLLANFVVNEPVKTATGTR